MAQSDPEAAKIVAQRDQNLRLIVDAIEWMDHADSAVGKQKADELRGELEKLVISTEEHLWKGEKPLTGAEQLSARAVRGFMSREVYAYEKPEARLKAALKQAIADEDEWKQSAPLLYKVNPLGWANIEKAWTEKAQESLEARYRDEEQQESA